MKKKSRLRIIIAIILFAILPLRSNFSSDVRLGCDGEVWRRLDTIEPTMRQMVKIVFVRGIYEGAAAVDEEKAREIYYMSVKYSDMSNELDAFYIDEKNMRIPVSQALKIICGQKKNKTPTDLQKMLSDLRFRFGRSAKATLVPKGKTEAD